ncbi:MAG: mannose-1-phosphate guanylyltransferase/mannose-6-phosphate isomerase [Hydrogenophilales bacterium]|nr:mannose-1-phosphate guanylyltransferase/mannose-6-phosphate isomerase [Hydrogenophilales bacterium]
MNIQPVILCGGSGTRLWPLSREQYPKQLLKLAGDHTMLQATALRLQDLTLDQGDQLLPPLLVGNEEYRFLMAQQMQEIGVPHAPILLEPCGRNTAPALTLAALSAADDTVLVVMPADHIIQDQPAFQKAVESAIHTAASGKIVTFGIVPDTPETGYGYIQVQDSGLKTQDARLKEQGSSNPTPPLESCNLNLESIPVHRFVEKPDRETAQRYLEEGGYFWNSGLFVVKAGTWIDALARCRPDILAACQRALEGRQQDHDFCRPNKAMFEACPSDSIDYAVLEVLAHPERNTGEVMVIPLVAQWSDVGAWSALWQIGEKDADNNVLMGDALAIDTRDTLVVGQSRLVACIGLDNVVIVDTPDAVLVAQQGKIQQVKDIVNQLKKAKRSETHAHRKVYRPWGWYDSIDAGPRFQVKRIVVNPGACLSLQMHHHRAEHWVVVSGTAKVTRGEEVIIVSENESTYIPLGTKHRLENPGKLPLEMIEVQSGAYLGEDDIVRFEDVYGRNQ